MLDIVIEEAAARYYDDLAPAIDRISENGIAAIRADLRDWLRRASEDNPVSPGISRCRSGSCTVMRTYRTGLAVLLRGDGPRLRAVFDPPAFARAANKPRPAIFTVWNCPRRPSQSRPTVRVSRGPQLCPCNRSRDAYPETMAVRSSLSPRRSGTCFAERAMKSSTHMTESA